MKRQALCAAPLLAALLLLPGCGGLQRSTEDRINAAMPLDAQVVTAKAALDAQVVSQPAEAKRIGEAYAAQLKARALDCAHGYAPSVFADPARIRAALTDKNCFATADHALTTWIGMRRVGLLLAAPPLHPVPKAIPLAIAGDAFIEGASFADEAGVALLQSPGTFQAIDIGSGATIARGESDGFGPHALSPNGRLFVAGSRRDAVIRDTETGNVLMVVPGVPPYQFHWAGNLGAIFTPDVHSALAGSRLDAPVFLDFATGQRSTIPMTGHVEHLVRLPGAEPRFAVLVFTRFAEVKLVRGAQGWEAQLVAEHPLSTEVSWALNTSGATADGKVFFGSGQAYVELLSLETLAARRLDFNPLQLQFAVPTADPDGILLAGFFKNSPGADTDVALYSLGQRTMTAVDLARLPSRRLIYVPVLHRNAVIADTKIVVLDALPSAVPLPINDYLEQREAMHLVQASQSDVASQDADPAGAARASFLVKMQQDNQIPANVMAEIQKQHGVTDAMMESARRAAAAPLPVQPTYPGPVAELGRTADIEAIGVYEGKGGGGQAGMPAGTGTVQVIVFGTPRPIILALNAYDPVRWVITLQPGAKIAAILSSGYGRQDVMGGGNARVYRMGQQYAYKRGSSEFRVLDAEVTRWTGKPIGVFQGSYTGETFTVGR